MKYIFFGSPSFAAIILEKLIESGLKPTAVVCNPDRPVGRKKIITAPPTKIIAQKYNIPVWQPDLLEIKIWELEIEKFGGIDFAIVAAYSQIIPKTVLESLPAKFLGVHPSLLPKYRGATPIQSTILNGDTETGVTLYLIDEKVDHGAIIANTKYQISNIKKYEEILKDLAELAVDLLIKILPKFTKGEIAPQPQKESEASYTKKFIGEDGYIDPEILRQAQDGANLKEAMIIERRIRALNPEPGVWTTQNEKRVKLLEAQIQNGKLQITKLQVEGKKAVGI